MAEILYVAVRCRCVVDPYSLLCNVYCLLNWQHSSSDVVVQWAVEQEMLNSLITVGAVDTLCRVIFPDAM